MPVTPVLSILRPKDCKMETSLSYIIRPVPKPKPKPKQNAESETERTDF